MSDGTVGYNVQTVVDTKHHLIVEHEVTNVGKTSITLNIEARKYNLYSSEETVVCTTSVTFVRIDEDGVPTAIGDSVRQRHQQLEKAEAPLG